MKNKLTRGLITHSLENISKDIFSKHSELITRLIEKSSGVYALYDENELYYVGRATQLRTRVKQHLKDRHNASWTHFSFYLMKNDKHIGEIESLLIRIANPSGNSVKPKGRDSRKLHKLLQNLIKQKHREELSDLFSKDRNKSVTNDSRAKRLKGMVKKRTTIYRTYKGKEHKAILTPAGSILYGKKQYSTPTSAAKAIVDRTSVNGWRFWYIRNQSGEWVKLAYY